MANAISGASTAGVSTNTGPAAALARPGGEIRYEPGSRIVIDTAQLPSSGAGIDAKWYTTITSRDTTAGVTTEFATVRCFIDLAGSVSAASTGAGQIIGTGGSSSTLGQYTAATMGTLLGGRMICLETPTGGVADIDLISGSTAGEDSGDAATDEVTLVDGGSLSAGGVAVIPVDNLAADRYLYLHSIGATAATYTAGKFLLEFECQYTITYTTS